MGRQTVPAEVTVQRFLTPLKGLRKVIRAIVYVLRGPRYIPLPPKARASSESRDDYIEIYCGRKQRR